MTLFDQKSLCAQHWKIYDSCEGNMMRIKLNKKTLSIFPIN